MASAVMLKMVRYAGYRCATLNVHCAQAPAAATIVAACGPSMMSAIRSAAYETESVDSLLGESSSFTFQSDVRHEATTSAANTRGRGADIVSTLRTSNAVPANTTQAM